VIVLVLGTGGGVAVRGGVLHPAGADDANRSSI
jgi:hypothetical protein